MKVFIVARIINTFFFTPSQFFWVKGKVDAEHVAVCQHPICQALGLSPDVEWDPAEVRKMVVFFCGLSTFHERNMYTL